MRGEAGIFPVGEASIVGGPGREGKTTIVVGLLTSYALQIPVAGMAPQSPKRAVILSAEDDRAQYVRKIAAQEAALSSDQRSQLRERLIIPDLDDPRVRAFKQLVSVIDKHPKATPTVDAIIAALTPMTTDPVPLGLVVVETSSTWNDAPEDNPGHRAMALACKRIARELQVAVVLVHHTSQAAANNLPTLDISSNDIRGGTALINNTRQSWLVVNLGSEEEPFQANDSRTILREAVAPNNPHRISVLVCLDSSKSEDPPPVFLQWEGSGDFGPRTREVLPAREFVNKRWRKVHSMIRTRKADKRQEAKDTHRQQCVRKCIDVVKQMHLGGKHPTVRSVSSQMGHGASWAERYLADAVENGELRCGEEQVPRARGLTRVYRPVHSS
jgi:hypothetical protein